MLPSGNGLRPFGIVPVNTEEVVAVFQLAVQGIETPAADAASERDNDAAGAPKP